MIDRPPFLSQNPPVSSDTLSDVLQAIRLTGAVFFRVAAAGPWVARAPHGKLVAKAVLPQAQHVFEYHMVSEGECWARVAGEAPLHLRTGDIVVLPHGDGHTLASDPALEGELDLAPYEAPRPQGLPFSLRIGEGGQVDSRVVCGFLGCDARPFNPLFESLPRLLHVARRDDDTLLAQCIGLAAAESDARRAGGECLLARVSELMFVQVLRRYLEDLPEHRSGWLAGLRDPQIGRALGLLHGQVARPWTLESLSREVGLSRSALAEKFTALVGRPPMQYLAAWRMQVAANLLRCGDFKVAAVAQRVGYDSEAAFSRAFKKATGVPPASWRSTSG